MVARKFNIEKLFMRYWSSKINKVREEFLSRYNAVSKQEA